MKQKAFDKPYLKEMISALSVLMSIAMVASVAAFFLYRMITNRAYRQKWSDYDDCGLA